MLVDLHTCQFVNFSDLFYELGELKAEFIDGDPDCSWGNNNRTLVVADDIVNHLNGNTDYPEQIDNLIARVCELPEGGRTYVDLEN